MKITLGHDKNDQTFIILTNSSKVKINFNATVEWLQAIMGCEDCSSSSACEVGLSSMKQKSSSSRTEWLTYSAIDYTVRVCKRRRNERSDWFIKKNSSDNSFFIIWQSSCVLNYIGHLESHYCCRYFDWWEKELDATIHKRPTMDSPYMMLLA